jgi:Uma2 family endonuclease
MDSILDAPSVRRATYQLSVAHYHQLNEIDLRKAALYAEAAVPEYWLVEPRTKRITVFRLPGDRSYAQSTVYEGAQTVACAALPGFEVDLPKLFT